MSDFKPLVGIDLGTTFSAIAYIDEHGKPVVIPNQENSLTTPSVVHFFDNDNFVVGSEAVNNLLSDQKNTVSFIKRDMGESDYKINIYGKDYTPQEVSALILRKLKTDAESYFRNQGMEVEVKDAVITVPAYFGMDQKEATKDAGELAGLNVSMIINEPSAAALAFGVNQLGKDQCVFVFDLGGGTFDVTILDISGNDIRMVASDGHAELGGKDWDDVLVMECSKFFQEKYGEDPQNDPSSYQELYDRVLRAKISLSRKPKASIQVSCGGNRENLEITQERFEELASGLVSRCQTLCEKVLEKADRTWADIDTVLLVGGSTYMPMVRSMVKEISKKDPSTDVNPDQCVALGAAYQARYLFIADAIEKVEEELGEVEAAKAKKMLLGALPDITITESVARSLGVLVLDEETGESDRVYHMIKEKTDIPARVDESFGYAFDGQTSVQVEISEGEGETREEVEVIGSVVLNNLPPRPAGTPISVIFTYNRDKTLDVEVLDVQTGTKQKGKVVFGGSMTDEQKSIAKKHIAKMKQD